MTVAAAYLHKKMEDVMFHTSPAKNRTSIFRHGLRPAPALAGMNATGVYLWSNLDQHWQLTARIVSEEGFDPLERPFDLWRVRVAGLDLQPDRSPGPRAHGAFFTPDPVPAAQLELAATFQTVADYLGVRDLDELREELGVICEDELICFLDEEDVA